MTNVPIERIVPVLSASIASTFGAMSAPDEILQYVRVLVWPSLLTFVIILFRVQVAQLILRLKSLPTPWGQAEFGAETAKLADQAASIQEQVVPSTKAPRVMLGLSPTVGSDPTIAFMDTYNRLESMSRDVAGTLQLRHWQPVPVIRELNNRGNVPKEAVALIERLRDIRNSVVHGTLRLQGPDAENLVEALGSLADILQANAQPSVQ